MKNLLLKITLLIAIITGTVMMPAVASAALDCSNPATAKEQIQCGSCQASGDTTCNPATAPAAVGNTVRTVINIISVFAGAIAVIMIIIGGFRYITSSGNAEATKNARNTIVYALIGLVIISLAQLIVHFVIGNLNNCSNGTTTTGQACK